MGSEKLISILVTGGAGYVGSHCVLELLQKNYNVLVIDNLVNAVQLNSQCLPESLIRVEKSSGRKLVHFYNGNIGDTPLLEKIFRSHEVQIVIHFAALKAVGESVANPLAYYENNVACTLRLLDVMNKFAVKKFIFSSSATVYGKEHGKGKGKGKLR